MSTPSVRNVEAQLLSDYHQRENQTHPEDPYIRIYTFFVYICVYKRILCIYEYVCVYTAFSLYITYIQLAYIMYINPLNENVNVYGVFNLTAG